ncbi:unnamed protein product [Pleuronectes platessa]|uniref:Uncharacterized protein n=1 Tax=Pleuronectes platessa TaxID=8262 RepID=A0A9N7UMI6_PLEPL|nr:unnamed protein product [Pleuronectes platessa]
MSARGKWKAARERHAGRCTVDVNKARRDVSKPVAGQDENAKQASQQTLKKHGAETLAAKTQAPLKSTMCGAGGEKPPSLKERSKGIKASPRDRHATSSSSLPSAKKESHI